mmetsp:Transcript_11439/g.28309  ORF Transcript_11439/g.28309 Transcript_11439/m.28309 type:complete len:97 (-) Transcript_11439:544-834(-)
MSTGHAAWLYFASRSRRIVRVFCSFDAEVFIARIGLLPTPGVPGVNHILAAPKDSDQVHRWARNLSRRDAALKFSVKLLLAEHLPTSSPPLRFIYT